MKNNKGFTIIEISVALTIFTALALLMFGVMQENLRAWRLGAELTTANASERTAQTLIAAELADAAMADEGGVGLTGLEVLDRSGDPVLEGVVGAGIRFQRPQMPVAADIAAVPSDQNNDGKIDTIDALLFFPDTLNGLSWTTPITIQHDSVNNTIVRLQDGVGGAAADGDFTDDGETRILANDVESVSFTMNGMQLSTVVDSQRDLIGQYEGGEDGHEAIHLDDTLEFSVSLVN